MLTFRAGCLVILILTVFISLLGAFPQSALYLSRRRMQQDIYCSADQYQHDNMCCLNCRAGTHVKSHCTSSGEMGRCEECDHGLYMEHASGLDQCFKCTQCHLDQEVVRPCNSTQDTVCQCKQGRFCVPDQACEVCKKCSRCDKDEEIVRNCTSTSNTECKKIQPPSTSVSALVVPPVLFAVGLISLTIGCVWKKSKVTGSQRHLPDSIKDVQCYTDNCPAEERRNGDTLRASLSNWQLVRDKSLAGVEDERKMLCESLKPSASNSQHRLTSLPSSVFPALPLAVTSVLPRQPNRREEEQFTRLIPLDGEASLRKCFEYLEEIEVDCHKRFFRHLGISDNVIKSKENLPYEDKIHDLLNIWVEKEGREASLNELLKVLLNLNQRRTAETVREKAIHNGHYICGC
ncbi:tumor necrosis factor receptor superfamily member 10A-like isoform X2 [Echeneis naucrates]|uniref:tumor necrosis factor receptor superfamily member 10A-like isoform X2 n=1 Tax=Echeneis naucrates TaxID=173247 RepID=UPI00111401A2|nr:tumor necrosis factor receptor superfamily member 10A-like isoform X2 [Echeneis naucrates]